MKPLGRHDMGLHQAQQGIQRRTDRSTIVPQSPVELASPLTEAKRIGLLRDVKPGITAVGSLRVVRDANAARLRKPFKTGGDIDTIAKDIAVIDYDVADVNADAKFDALGPRHDSILFSLTGVKGSATMLAHGNMRVSHVSTHVALEDVPNHDQGHIPVKLLGFEVDPATGRWQELSGVNVTLGLPIIRASGDHGTAFDIAGKGIANERSLIEAIEYAERLAAGASRQ
jgi:hypothetical protein